MRSGINDRRLHSIDTFNPLPHFEALSTTYYYSVVFYPAIAFAILVIASLCVPCWPLCFLPRRPQFEPGNGASSDRRRLHVFLYAVGIGFTLSLGAAFFTVWGTVKTEHGWDTIYDAVVTFQNDFFNIRSITQQLVINAQHLESELEVLAKACPDAASVLLRVSTQLAVGINSATEVIDATSDVSGRVHNFEHIYRRFVHPYSTLVAWVGFGLIAAVVVLRAVSTCGHRPEKPRCFGRCATRCALCVIDRAAAVLFMALALLFAAELYGFLVLNGYCDDPSQNVLRALPSGHARDYLTYYSDCNGTNPVEQKLQPAEETLRFALAAVPDLSAVCSDQAHEIAAVRSNANSSLALLLHVESLAACVPLSKEWHALTDGGICSDVRGGLAVDSVACLSAAVFILASLLAVRHWHATAVRLRSYRELLLVVPDGDVDGR